MAAEWCSNSRLKEGRIQKSEGRNELQNLVCVLAKGGSSGRKLCDFNLDLGPMVLHSPLVTSNLVPLTELARSWSRPRQSGEIRSQPSKLFVLKILTSKLFDIKILQTLFAEPAPSKTFRGGRGYHRFQARGRTKCPAPGRPLELYFSQESTARFALEPRLKYPRRPAKTVAEWACWNWSLGGCVCPTERPA